jgi:uncharacterized membrane protein
VESRTRIFGHAVHQSAVAFPVGLLGSSVLFDMFSWVMPNSLIWATTAYLVMGAGIVSAVFVAPFGLRDWMAIPRHTRARRVGQYHMLLMTITVTLFMASLWLRQPPPSSPNTVAHIISTFAGVLLAVGGWFGGELVSRHGIAVSPHADLNASSSHAGTPTPASESDTAATTTSDR